MPRKKRARYGEYCELRDGVTYARVNIPIGNGRYKTIRKRVPNRTAARQWAEAQLAKLHQSDDLDTFIDLAEWYKDHYLVAPVYENGVKVEGTKDYKRSIAKLERISAYFGPRKLSLFAEKDLMAYVRHRRSHDEVSTATINRDLALMRVMFRKAHESDRSINVPKFPINVNAEVERDRVLGFDEERALLDVCGRVERLSYKRQGKVIEAESRTNREHLKAIIIMAVDTAMRAGEILSLTWEDVDIDAGIISIQSHNSKTEKARKVGITPRLRKELETIRKDKGKVFGVRSVRKAFATACKRAKIKDLHFHDLRHTATTRMIRAGIPHTEVMKITGHSQIKTFLRYLNLGDSTVQNTAQLLARYVEQE